MPGDTVEYSHDTFEEGVARFRRHAVVCHQQAVQAIDPLDKEAWLLLADNGEGS